MLHRKPNKLKELPAAKVSETWSNPLEEEVLRLLAVLFFEPLIRAFKEPKNNAAPNRSVLIRAIENGSLVFRDGAFEGQRNATLSRTLQTMGAKFNKTRKAWAIKFEELPADVRLAIDAARKKAILLEAQTARAVQEVSEKAKAILPEVSFQGLSRETMLKMADKIRATVPKEISVQPTIDPQATKTLNAEYTDNIKLSIAGFIEDEVARFRKEILPEIKAGVGRKALREYVDARMKVGKDRAKFIARQETSLFTSKLKQVQYQEAGIEKYKWKAIGGQSGDGRTRDAHMAAHGDVFFWDHSKNRNPVRNSKGEPVHPGEDFGCRCQAIPVVEEL